MSKNDYIPHQCHHLVSVAQWCFIAKLKAKFKNLQQIEKKTEYNHIFIRLGTPIRDTCCLKIIRLVQAIVFLISCCIVKVKIGKLIEK